MADEDDDVLDLTIKQEVLKLKKGGVDKYYVLRELNGEQRDKHVNFLMKRTGGSEKNVEGLQSHLLTMCLFEMPDNYDPETDEDVKGTAVPAKMIQTWPSRLVVHLYERAALFNGLTEKAKADAGKD